MNNATPGEESPSDLVCLGTPLDAENPVQVLLLVDLIDEVFGVSSWETGRFGYAISRRR